MKFESDEHHIDTDEMLHLVKGSLVTDVDYL